MGLPLVGGPWHLWLKTRQAVHCVEYIGSLLLLLFHALSLVVLQFEFRGITISATVRNVIKGSTKILAWQISSGLWGEMLGTTNQH